MTVLNLNLQAQYGYVIIVAALLAIEVNIFGIIFAGRTRMRTFTQTFMKENFSEVHAKQFKEEIKAGGYPDMGNGRYSERLTYSDWYIFNVAQRVHLNFVEAIASTLAVVLLSGLYLPVYGASFGFLIFLGRAIYGIGYSSKGPQGRFIGVIMHNIGFFACFILSIISGAYMIQGKTSV